MDSDANALTAAPTVGGDDGTRYELLGRLAVGGMAELYLARAVGSDADGRVVVLKRILPHLSEDPEFVRMFRDEAYLAATLDHPNIVRVFDIGRHNDDYFFTMEYVHGENLRGLLRAAQKREGTEIPLQHLLTVMIGITSGLHYAHERVDGNGRPLQIVHRDVSPTNVLVSYDGSVKIVDFGIAKAAAGTHVTQAGMLKGKAAYMSPEQCRADKVDRRSDVFAIGILLYEMSTLTRLFKGDNELAILHQVLLGSIDPPTKRTHRYPPELERIVLRALQNKPEDRYQTALELREDLENFARSANITPSTTELGQYMLSLFGYRPLPWAQMGIGAPSLPSKPAPPAKGDLTPDRAGSPSRPAQPARRPGSQRIAAAKPATYPSSPPSPSQTYLPPPPDLGIDEDGADTVMVSHTTGKTVAINKPLSSLIKHAPPPPGKQQPAPQRSQAPSLSQTVVATSSSKPSRVSGGGMRVSTPGNIVDFDDPDVDAPTEAFIPSALLGEAYSRGTGTELAPGGGGARQYSAFTPKSQPTQIAPGSSSGNQPHAHAPSSGHTVAISGIPHAPSGQWNAVAPAQSSASVSGHTVPSEKADLDIVLAETPPPANNRILIVVMIVMALLGAGIVAWSMVQNPTQARHNSTSTP